MRRLLLLLALTGCTTGVTIRGTVEVPVEIQELFAIARPGVVHVAAEIPETGLVAARLAVLCDATEAPLAIELDLDTFGCAKESTLLAWAAAVPNGAELACGIDQQVDDTAAPPLGTIATASVVIFEGNTAEDGCEVGEATVDLVLSL
ncbi:MAG: hypothetical protein KF773_10965 [Deltaproteobacteria bacterium]|nr:hypothetical protein [Deltaproteobacteria bacterium]